MEAAEGLTGSHLRHRATATTANDDSPPCPPKPDPTGTWQEELAEARRSVAERMRKQHLDDGWEDLGDHEEEGGEANEAAGAAAGRRRGSASSGELVREMLQSREAALVVAPAPAAAVPVGGAEAEGAGGRAAGAHPPEANDDGEKLCRFCFDGEDPEQGRLFSPCLCRGTSRYVHVACLDAWRLRGVGEASFYRCQQCLYEYKLGRTKIAGLATNRFALSAVTTVFLLFLIFLAGFVATYLIESVEARQSRLTGSMFDEFFVTEYDIVGESVREAVSLFKHVEKDGWQALKNIEVGGPYQKALPASATTKSRSKSSTLAELPPTTLFMRTVRHFSKGFSLVGLLSFIQLTIASSPMFLLRFLRPPRRREGDNRPSISQIMIVLAVLWGIGKAVMQVYRFVRWSAERVLRKVEVMVLDVGAE